MMTKGYVTIGPSTLLFYDYDVPLKKTRANPAGYKPYGVSATASPHEKTPATLVSPFFTCPDGGANSWHHAHGASRLLCHRFLVLAAIHPKGCGGINRNNLTDVVQRA